MKTQARRDHGDTPATPFELGLQRLRRLESERRCHDRQERAAEGRLRTQRILLGLATLDRVEALLRELVQDLGAVLGRSIDVSRRLFDGRYELGLRLEESRQDRDGRCHDYYSRVQVLLDPRAEQGRMALECHTTVHNQDLPSERFEGELLPAASEAVRAFLEQQLLAFAERYCAFEELARIQDMLDLGWAEAALAA